MFYGVSMGARRKYPDDLSGHVFGRLTLLSLAGRDKAGQRWLCKCECGTVKTIQRSALVAGVTVSCGCYSVERTRRQGYSNLKHGMSDTPTYESWSGMHKRCNDAKDDRYGGRGIKVCERWSDFEAFLADMGERPPGTSIERDDVNGNYCPQNCRWATDEEQANNRRSTRYVEFDGMKKSLAQWAREIGVKPGTLRFRLERGWSVERALTTIGKQQ